MRLVACMADIMSMNIECMECEKEVSRMGNGRRVECDLCDDMRLKIETLEGTMVTNVGIYEIRVSSDGGTPPSVLSGIQLSTLPASQGPSSRLYGLAPMRFAVSPYPRERHRPTDHPSTPRLCRF